MHKEKTQRQLRINKRIRQIIAEMFMQSDFEIAGKKVFVNILKADISPDLRNVSIYISFSEISEEDKRLITKELNKKEYVKQIRMFLAKKLDLRVAPVPTFILDKSQEKKYKMAKLLEEEAKKFNK